MKKIVFYNHWHNGDIFAGKGWVQAIKEQQLKELEILARVTFTVPCAACKVESEVIVNPKEDNHFVCPNCKARNSVYLSAEAALVTEPIKVDTI